LRSASVVLGASVLAALAVTFAASRVSPTLARANLPLDESGLEGVFLTQLADDPGRVLYTTRRENSTWSRDMQTQAGNAFWIRRYGDPAHPGLPPRILIQSRSRGAHLFLPLGALDLERSLSWPTANDDAATRVRHQLVQMYVDREFAGVYLELRFPERREDASGDPIDHDLVFVRGNRVRTTDCSLRPDGELYRAALVDGRQPAGDLRRNAGLGDEFAFLMPSAPDAPCTPMPISISMFDELSLMWGDELGTLLDDRWDAAALPAAEFAPPEPALRDTLAVGGSLHMAARVEDDAERVRLQRALKEFTDG
jgi:hypothetical protein